MEILENFGFEPVFFGAQVINFLILFVVFKKFLYKPILKLLKDREKTIAQGLEDSQLASKVLEEASLKKDDIIRAATLEAEKIIDETKKNANIVREDVLTKSRLDAEKIIKQAQEAGQAELNKIKDQARDLSLDLAKRVLDRVLDELFTKQEKEKILNRNVKRFEKYE